MRMLCAEVTPVHSVFLLGMGASVTFAPCYNCPRSPLLVPFVLGLSHITPDRLHLGPVVSLHLTIG